MRGARVCVLRLLLPSSMSRMCGERTEQRDDVRLRLFALC
jgi:hypothetical protein